MLLGGRGRGKGYTDSVEGDRIIVDEFPVPRKPTSLATESQTDYYLARLGGRGKKSHKSHRVRPPLPHPNSTMRPKDKSYLIFHHVSYSRPFPKNSTPIYMGKCPANRNVQRYLPILARWVSLVDATRGEA